MPRTELIFNITIILGALVLITNQKANGCSCCLPFKTHRTRISTSSGSRRCVVNFDCPGRLRLSIHGWISAFGQRATCGGTPSTTQPMAGTMALTKCGETKNMTKPISGHYLFPSCFLIARPAIMTTILGPIITRNRAKLLLETR